MRISDWSSDVCSSDLPTYHTAALSTDNLAKEYFGEEAMLGYVKNVQRAEIRQGIDCVKHQNMSGSDIGDDHKDYFAGEAALKAAGKDNTMNKVAACKHGRAASRETVCRYGEI